MITGAFHQGKNLAAHQLSNNAGKKKKVAALVHDMWLVADDKSQVKQSGVLEAISGGELLEINEDLVNLHRDSQILQVS